MTFHILTVGDGDLSLSLALARAYASSPEQQEHVKVTASTLVASREDLCQIYPVTAPANLRDLEDTGCNVLYGTDATQLHHLAPENANAGWNCTVFYHPHLGDVHLRHENESAHADRHYRLLAHYLASAAAATAAATATTTTTTTAAGLAGQQQRAPSSSTTSSSIGTLPPPPTGPPLIHLCLCGTQADTWRLLEAAAANNLRLWKQQSTRQPFHKLLAPHAQLEAAKPGAALRANRSSRNGRAGARDWLTRYGYRHQRTHGCLTDASTKQVDLSGSTHYVFTVDTAATDGQPATRIATYTTTEPTMATDSTVSTSNNCDICGLNCSSPTELLAHLQAPAVPDAPLHVPDTATATLTATAPDTTNSIHGATETVSTTTTPVPIHSDIVASTETLNDKGLSEGNLRQTVAVSAHDDGKRLRWYIQHCMSPPKRSKKESELLVRDGKVLVDDQVALDSGRILRADVQVSIQSDNDESSSAALIYKSIPSIRIVKAWSESLQVVWKPVSMRAIGSFDGSTLEQTFSRQTGCSYKSLSKLDTGCSGLCVLQKDKISNQRQTIHHIFTALVHGHVPSEWKEGTVDIDLPMDGMRRWRKRPLSETAEHDDSPKTAIVSNIQCPEQTDFNSTNGVPELSTVIVSTDSSVSGLGSTICFYLRKAGHPVVGDRFAGTEYLSLPRPMRNRIKHRLSIGCTRVECRTLNAFAEDSTPEKWKASYWQQFGAASSALTTVTVPLASS